MALNIDECASIQGMALGGPENDKLLISTAAGKQSLVYLTSSKQTGVAAFEVVSHSHTGEVTGSCPGIRSSDVVTCSVDGRVCVWDCTSQNYLYNRAFAAKFSAITSLRQLGVIIVGSHAGILRVVQGGPGLPVVCRSRVSDLPISYMVSAMDGATGILACSCGASIILSRVSHTGRLCGMKSLALSGVPTALTLAHPVSGIQLLVSLEASELVCVDAAVAMLPDGPCMPERRMRLPAPIATMCCLRSPSENSIGRICGVFVDHTLRYYDLTSDAAAWSTAKGRGMRAQDVLEVDGSVAGADIAAAANDFIVVASPSGSVWRADLSSHGQTPVCSRIGDAAGGGVKTVSFNAAATMIVFGCEDGSVVFSMAGTQCSSEDLHAMKQITADQTALTRDRDTADDVDEPVHMNKQPMEVLPIASSSNAMQASVEQSSIMFKLTALKERLQLLLQQNGQAPTSERVNPNDLAVHTGLAASLRQAGRRRVEELRRGLMRSFVHTKIACQRIRAECQTGMTMQQHTLRGIRLPTLIHSYPQRQQDSAHPSLKHMRFLQAVEAAEWRSTGRSGTATAFTGQQPSSDQKTQQSSEEDMGPSLNDLLQGPSCLYSEWDLITVRRRIIALRVLEAKVMKHQLSFNVELEQVAKKRHNAEEALLEQNSRLNEAFAELQSMGFNLAPEDCKLIQVRGQVMCTTVH